MELDQLWQLADRARASSRFSPADIEFVRGTLPGELGDFPNLELPKRIRHPAGFSVSGASVGTFLRSAILLAGQRGLGKRYDGMEFYGRVERDVAFGIMRSHFHNGYPKGTYCCAQCTLALLPLLESGAIRYFNCRELSQSVRALIEEKRWRFAGSVNPEMIRWSLG